MSVRRRLPKLGGGETHAHVNAKRVIASTLRAALRKATPFVISTLETCRNQGSFFRCNASSTREWLQLDAEQLRAPMSVAIEHTLDALRFDVALLTSGGSGALSKTRPTLASLDVLAQLCGTLDASDDRLYRALHALAVRAHTSEQPPLVLPGLTAQRRRDVHTFCELAGLEHATIGSRNTRTMFVRAPERSRATSTPSLLPALVPQASVLAAFEVLHTSPMSRDKLSLLTASGTPFVEVLSAATDGTAMRWPSVRAPLHCVRSSLPPPLCADCASDPTQQAFKFTRLFALVDLFAPHAVVGRRLLFAELQRKARCSLVEYCFALPLPTVGVRTRRQSITTLPGQPLVIDADDERTLTQHLRSRLAALASDNNVSRCADVLPRIRINANCA